MQSFAAQQLSKKEMNNVKGGNIYHCTVSINGAKPVSGPVSADSLTAATDRLMSMYEFAVTHEGDRVDVQCS